MFFRILIFTVLISSFAQAGTIRMNTLSDSQKTALAQELKKQLPSVMIRVEPYGKQVWYLSDIVVHFDGVKDGYLNFLSVVWVKSGINSIMHALNYVRTDDNCQIQKAAWLSLNDDPTKVARYMNSSMFYSMEIEPDFMRLVVPEVRIASNFVPVSERKGLVSSLAAMSEAFKNAGLCTPKND